MVFWAAVILGFVALKEYTLRSGTEVLLETVPVDPRDLFRGDYVVLRYKISTIDLSLYPVDNIHSFDYDYDPDLGEYNAGKSKTPGVKEGDDIFVILRKEKTSRLGGSIYAVSKVYKTLTPSKNELFIRGKVKKVDGTGGTIEVEYGIESYFVPEGKGREIERQRGRNLDVKVAVDKLGNAVIKDLLIDGKVFRFE